MSEGEGKSERQKRVDQILAYIKDHGVIDKDKSLSSQSPKKAVRNKGRSRYTLDLHGLTSEKAASLLRRTVASCKKRGISEILVIHGWGLHSQDLQPVLKTLVRDMLEHELRYQIRGYRAARPSEGGEGATVVRL